MNKNLWSKKKKRFFIFQQATIPLCLIFAGRGLALVVLPRPLVLDLPDDGLWRRPWQLDYGNHRIILREAWHRSGEFITCNSHIPSFVSVSDDLSCRQVEGSLDVPMEDDHSAAVPPCASSPLWSLALVAVGTFWGR